MSATNINPILQRVDEFWQAFKRSRKGTVGVLILLLFAGISIAAPVISPYDPTESTYLAGAKAMPFWARSLPGNERLSENVMPIADPGFSTGKTSLNSWQIETTPKPAATVDYCDDDGYERGSGRGCVVVTLPVEEVRSEQVKVTIAKRFTYPFDGSPDRFIVSLAVRVKNVGSAPVKIASFIANVSGYRYILWERSITRDEGWFVPEYPIDSYSSRLRTSLFKDVLVDPASIIFSRAGEYTYGLEVSFSNLTSKPDLLANVYLDDIDLRLLGTAFGWLGTDQWGRDIFTQMLYGARVSLIVGLLSAFISVLVGLAVGSFSGYLGGFVDDSLMRFADMLLVLPQISLLLVLTAMLGRSSWNIILMIGLLGWMSFSRVIRSQVLSLKQRPFIEAARAAGCGTLRILFRHIMPNLMSLTYVALALAVPAAILAEAGLSWLGLGDPSAASWGRILHDATRYGAVREWWWVIPPGLGIALLSLSFIMIGYAVDEIFNPKLRRS